jgi:glycine/D-amino acid oxidase-like deaminating enzyme
VFDNADVEVRSGWAGERCVSRDRKPLIGEVGEGLLCFVAMGSRGFSWAPIAGEMLASHVAGAPEPPQRNVTSIARVF